MTSTTVLKSLKLHAVLGANLSPQLLHRVPVPSSFINSSERRRNYLNYRLAMSSHIRCEFASMIILLLDEISNVHYGGSRILRFGKLFLLNFCNANRIKFLTLFCPSHLNYSPASNFRKLRFHAIRPLRHM